MLLWIHRFVGFPLFGAISSDDSGRNRHSRSRGPSLVQHGGSFWMGRLRQTIPQHLMAAMIGEKAGVVVRQDQVASAHDIRRGCAQRLINAGVSAETLKVVMRHADFATTEKYYGATRSAQAAASEVRQKLSTDLQLRMH